MSRIAVTFKDSERDLIILDFVERETNFTGETPSSLIKTLLYEAIRQRESGATASAGITAHIDSPRKEFKKLPPQEPVTNTVNTDQDDLFEDL